MFDPKCSKTIKALNLIAGISKIDVLEKHIRNILTGYKKYRIGDIPDIRKRIKDIKIHIEKWVL